MEPFVVCAHPRYLRRKLLLTVTGEGVVSPACGLVPWSPIRSYLENDVYDRDEFLSRIEPGWLRRFARAGSTFPN